MLTIVCDRVELQAGTVAVGVGHDEEGHVVRFAGDSHVLHELAETLNDERSVPVEIEPWQLVDQFDISLIE